LSDELELFVQRQLKGIPLFGLNYQNRVRKFAEEFSEGTANEEILNYAISLHNVSAKTLVLYGKEFHSASASVAENFLKNINLRNEKIEEIIECIKNAGINGLPNSVESKTLQNAVLAEFLGSTGIAYFLFIAGIKKTASGRLKTDFNEHLQKIDSIELLDSAKETINKRKKVFESFFNDLFDEFD
jgi:hypothetical protein